MMKYLLARIRYLYAIAAAVFGICATFMLYYRPRSVWGRWYLIVTIIMVVLCFDATLKARNAMKAGKAAGEDAGDSSEAGEDGTDSEEADDNDDTAMGTGADTNANTGVAEDECGAADGGEDSSMPAEAVGDSVSPSSGEGSADIASHGREKQAIENENGDETEAEDTVRTVHHPQERLP